MMLIKWKSKKNYSDDDYVYIDDDKYINEHGDDVDSNDELLK